MRRGSLRQRHDTTAAGWGSDGNRFGRFGVSLATMPRAILLGLAVLALAAGCTAGKQPSHPAPTSLAAKAPATSSPIATLRRPLRLPALNRGNRCPVTRSHQVQPAFAEVLGDGPAYPTDSAASWRHDYRIEGGWYYAKVLWVASLDHPGPFLVRGRQLDGRRELRFGEGPQPDPELLLPAGGTARSDDSDWFNWPSYTRLRGGGCYAYQVDAASGSQVIVFQA
jgi:hypothetical protein